MGKININIHSVLEISLSVLESHLHFPGGIQDYSRSPLVTCAQYFINKSPFGALEVFNVKYWVIYSAQKSSCCLKCCLLIPQSCLAYLALFPCDLVAGGFLSGQGEVNWNFSLFMHPWKKYTFFPVPGRKKGDVQGRLYRWCYSPDKEQRCASLLKSWISLESCCGLLAHQNNNSWVPEATVGRIFSRKNEAGGFRIAFFKGQHAWVLKRNLPLLKQEHSLPWFPL